MDGISYIRNGRVLHVVSPSPEAAIEEQQPWLSATPWPWASTRATKWQRMWASRGTAATVGNSPSTPSLCGTWSQRSVALSPMNSAPWSCSRSLRTRGPWNSSRKGWGYTSMPREERGAEQCPCSHEEGSSQDSLSPIPCVMKPVQEKKQKQKWNGPDWCGSVGWASSRKPKSPIQFLVRAYAWALSQVPMWGTREAKDGCFSPFLSLSFPLSKNKQISN